MTRLDDLLRIEGVMAAGEFTADGTLVDYRSNVNMPQEFAAMSAQFSATVSMVFNSLAAAFSHLTPMEWTPQQAWAYSGGDMTVAVGGRVGVFVKTEKADFNTLFQALVGDRALPLE